MKKLTLIAFLACLSCNKKEVLPPETAKERAEIEALIRKTDTLYKDFTLLRPDDFKFSAKSDSIIKEFTLHNEISRTFFYADLDSNGIDDILATGDNRSACTDIKPDGQCMFSSLVLMRYPCNKSKVIQLQREWRSVVVPQIVEQNGKALIHVFEPAKYIGKYTHIPNRRYTLTYRQGEFIEYNAEPVDNRIEKIEFTTDACFGTCPIYQLTLNKTGTSYFIAEHFNFSDEIGKDYNKEEGFFKCRINNKEYAELEGLLNYIDFEDLNKYYMVLSSDQPSSFLKITYGNGKIKRIGDYGKVGTYGLKKFYSLMDEIRFNQKWEKATEKPGIRITRREQIEN